MIKIIVVDDQTLFREGLVALLDAQPDLRVVDTASDGRTALEKVRGHKPDVVLMDVSMPGLNGIDATERLRRLCPESRVLALSMHASPALVRQMLAAGAAGYVLKDENHAALAQAVRRVGHGMCYLSPALMKKNDHGPAPAPPPLSRREREVIQLLAEGQSSSRIAALLHISVKTVESHRERIRAKLGITTTAGLVKFAIREGITDLNHS